MTSNSNRYVLPDVELTANLNMQTMSLRSYVTALGRFRLRHGEIVARRMQIAQGFLRFGRKTSAFPEVRLRFVEDLAGGNRPPALE